MSSFNNTYFHTLSTAGETFTINVDGTDPFTRYSFAGTGVLAGGITINTSGTPVEGSRIIIDYNCTFTIGGSKVTILGTDLNINLIGKSFTLDYIYNGSSWISHQQVDWQKDDLVYTAKIKDANVTGAKIANSTLSISNMDSTANLVSTIIEVSFEANEQCNNTIKMPTNFVLNSIYYEVIKALANTDVGTITPKINGSNVTLSSAISIPLSTVINTTASTNCTATNTGSAGDLVSFVAAKTTAGGKVRLTLNWSRA